MTYVTHSECSIEFEVDGPYKVIRLDFTHEMTIKLNY